MKSWTKSKRVPEAAEMMGSIVRGEWSAVKMISLARIFHQNCPQGKPVQLLQRDFVAGGVCTMAGFVEDSAAMMFVIVNAVQGMVTTASNYGAIPAAYEKQMNLGVTVLKSQEVADAADMVCLVYEKGGE